MAPFANPSAQIESASEFYLKLFSTRHSSRVKHGETGKWLAVSPLHSLSDQDILGSISLSNKTQRATSIDDKERFLLIELEAASLEVNPMLWISVKTALGRLGVSEPRIYRAAATNTYQIFLFFAEKLSVKDASRLLQKYLFLFDISANDALVRQPGDSFALPLLSDFAWLNDKLQPVVRRNEVALDAALALFMRDATRTYMQPAVFFESISALVQEKAASVECDVVVPSKVEADSVALVIDKAEAPALEVISENTTITLFQDPAIATCINGPFASDESAEAAPALLTVHTSAGCLDTEPEQPIMGAADDQMANVQVDTSDETFLLTICQEEMMLSSDLRESVSFGRSLKDEICPVEPSEDCFLMSIQCSETTNVAAVAEIKCCPDSGSTSTVGLSLDVGFVQETNDKKPDSLAHCESVSESASDGQDDSGKSHLQITSAAPKVDDIQLVLPMFAGLLVDPPPEPKMAKARGKPKRNPPDG